MGDIDFGWVARLDHSEPVDAPLMDEDDFRAMMEAAQDKARAEDEERLQRLLDEDASAWQWCVP